MTESCEKPEAGTGPEAENGAVGRAEPSSAPADGQPDSVNFERCSTCRHADGIDRNTGTLHCKKHDMYVDAEADEIPDDCAEYEARSERGEGRGERGDQK